MTDQGEFAQVEDKNTLYFRDIDNGMYVALGERMNVYAIAGEINAAVAAHVAIAKQDDREWVSKRLIAWMKGSEPANTAFTAGEMRQVAYTVEDKVRRAVEEFRERAAVEIKTKADARKCEVYGHDDRYCAYCSAYDDAVDISQQIIRAMPLSPAENQADGVTEGKS